MSGVESISSVIKEVGPQIRELPGVKGIGIGQTKDGRECVLILTQAISDALREDIQRRIAPLPTEFREVGEIRLESG